MIRALGRVLVVTALGMGVAAGWAGSTAAAAPTSVRSSEWWIQRWGLDDAWALSKGVGVTIAVVDSGVQGDVADLAGAVLPGKDLRADGGDGRIDLDPDSHGTAMASLIAARGVGSTGMIGVAPESKILPITFGLGSNADDVGGLGTAKAIRWAVDHDAKVINMSYGADDIGCVGPLREAVWYALDRDVILVAASGNDGSGSNRPEVPASCPGVVAVGAVSEDGAPWVDTQRQSYVDLAGPGVDTVAIDRVGHASRANGTSDAAALVSGVVALVRARFPEMPARQVVGRLLATAKDAGAPGKDDQTGYGIVRPLNALTENVPADAPNPVYEEVDRLRGTTAVPGHATTTTTRSTLPLVAAAVAGVAALLALLAILVTRRRRPPETANPAGRAFPPSRPGPGPGP